MPEDQVEQEVPEVSGDQDEQVESAELPEPTPEKHVPYTRFEKVNSEKHRLADQLHQTQLLLLQTQQAHLEGQTRKQAAPEEAIDPDVESLVGPIINKQTRFLQQKLQQQEQLLGAIAAKEEGNRAWAYVEANVPDIEELKPHILEYLDSLDPKLAHAYTSDPNSVVLVANLVRANRRAGISSVTKKVSADLKQRARSESGGNTKSGASDLNVNWSSLSGAELIAAQRKLGIKPIDEW